jgi:hypothetical protein
MNHRSCALDFLLELFNRLLSHDRSRRGDALMRRILCHQCLTSRPLNNGVRLELGLACLPRFFELIFPDTSLVNTRKYDGLDARPVHLCGFLVGQKLLLHPVSVNIVQNMNYVIQVRDVVPLSLNQFLLLLIETFVAS